MHIANKHKGPALVNVREYLYSIFSMPNQSAKFAVYITDLKEEKNYWRYKYDHKQKYEYIASLYRTIFEAIDGN